MSECERPIHLDLGMPPAAHREPDAQRGDTRNPPDDDARRRFEQAMACGDDGPAPAATGLPVAALPSGPLSTLPSGPLSALPPASQAPAGRLAGLGKALASLYVGDGSSGRREVRMQLAGDLLPGVSVSVFEEGGAWVAEFTCGDDTSRARLAASAHALVQEFANSLQRLAVWRVMTDDDEDLRLIEARAEPG